MRISSSEGLLLTQPEQEINTDNGADASANFSTGILAYQSGFEGSKVYLKYTVLPGTDAALQGNPHLVGKTIVVGPIRTVESTGTQTCAQALESPLIVVEFELEMKKFIEAVDPVILPRLAYRMGVQASRVLMSNLRVGEGIDPNTMLRWSGVKVDVTFTDPAGNSINKKSSAVLAAEFVALRSTCSQDVPGLLNIYYKSRELTCNIAAFRAARAATDLCIENAYVPRCHCYNRHIFQPLGSMCTYNDTLNAELNVLCNDILYCKDAYIQDVCTVVLLRNKKTYYWLMASGGVIVAGLIGTFVAWKKQMWCFRPRITYNDATNKHRRKK